MAGSTARALVIVAAAATLGGCFEEPVRQHLHLHLASGAVVAVWTHEVEAPSRAHGNEEVAARLDSEREALARQLTPASAWFERADAAAARTTLERVDGLVRRARWSAVFTGTRELEGLLAEMGLTAYLAAIDGATELVLEPSAPPRATRAQLQLADELLEAWAVEVADYLAAATELYAHLEQRPDRALPCFAHLFGEADRPGVAPLDDRERELVEAASDAIDDVASALLEVDDHAFSANELSRLAHDPFPARLTVSAAGGVIASDGFLRTPQGVERPPVSLWQALIDLEGVWLRPDLVTGVVAPAAEDAQPEPDPAAFAAARRWAASPPAAYEVADALRSRLATVSLSTVRWSGPAPGAPDLPATPAPRPLLDVAEGSIPR